jgi:hypothetical protein
MKEQRFKIGDKVTYKNKNDCPNNTYCYGGENQEGYVGTITHYIEFIEEHDCYKIEVTQSSDEFTFTMLESEFIEYESSMYKAGDWVVMIQNYVNLKVGEVYQLIKKQIIDGSCWVVNHCEENPYLAPYERNFRLAEPHEIPKVDIAADMDESQPESKFYVGHVVNINDQGYQCTDMGVLSKNPIYTWDVMLSWNIKSFNHSKVVIKDREYSKIQNKWWYKFDEIGNWISECGVESLSPSPVAIDPMDAILEEAIRKYPIGTKYKPLTIDESEYPIASYSTEYKPRIHFSNSIEGGIGFLYIDGKWAEIVAPSVTSSITATTSGVYRTPIVTNFLGGYIGDLDFANTPNSNVHINANGNVAFGYSSPPTFNSGTIQINGTSLANSMIRSGWSTLDGDITEQKDSLHRESTIKIMQL